MAVDNPWAIDALPLSALGWRRAASGLLVHDTDPVSARAGVLSGCAVTVAGLTATVGAGEVAVTPSVGSNGTYLVTLTSTALTVAVQDATYARIDRVIARVYDNSVDGSGQNKAAVEIVTGTPAASPVAPALPVGALELAQLQVPKSGSSIVAVDKRTWTVAAGGVLPVATRAVLAGITAPQSGMLAVSVDYGMVWRWTGSQWRHQGCPNFADATTRDAQITQPQAGDQCSTGTGASIVYWNYAGTGWVNAQSPVQSLGNVNLNTITAPGTYVQTTAGNVTTGNNYPPLAVGTAGVLNVVPDPGGSITWQTWSSVLGSWNRAYSASTWGSWQPLGSTLAAGATLPGGGPAISAANTLTQIKGLTAGYDDASMINLVTGVITTPVPGVYRHTLVFPWSSYGTAYARTLAFIKGTTNAGQVLTDLNAPVQTGKWHTQLSWEGLCAAGDQFTWWASTAASSSSGAEATTTAIPPLAITVAKVR